MNSTLIIGIGTTGLSIIEEIQQLHFEYTNSNKPGSNVAYIYLETDSSRKPRKTANGTTDIEQIVLNLGSNAVDIRQLKSNEKVDSDWVPEPSTVLQNESGAGGMPSYGRLSFWGNQNYQKLANIIRNKYSEINGDSNTQILIVGSLTGGTGSGLVVDVPYLVKSVTGNPNIEAVLLLPDRISFNSNPTLHENAFSALVAINHFSKPENTYSVTYPTGNTYSDEAPPYKYVQYLTQDFDNSKAAIKSLTELIRIAGSIGLLRILDTNSNVFSFYNRLHQRRVDSVGNDRLLNTLTSGVQFIQFPKSQLEQLLSVRLTKRILLEMVDKSNYILRNGERKPIEADKLLLKNNIQSKIDEILDRVFKNLDSLVTADGNLQHSIAKDIGNLSQKTHSKGSDEKYIYDLFANNIKQNYYELLKDNEVTIKHNLIDEIYSLFQNLIREYKNFFILEILLDHINVYFDGLINWYKSEFGLTGSSTDWNSVLQRKLVELTHTKLEFQILGLKKEYFGYLIQQNLDLLKINTIIPILQLLKTEFLGKSATTLMNPQSNRFLPTKKFIFDCISRIEYVLNNDGTDSNYSLPRREAEINMILDNEASCFSMVYTSGSKEQEIEVLDSNYSKNVSSKLDLEKLLGQNDFWAFFEESDKNLYEVVISNAQRFIQNSHLIDDFDFAGYLNKLDNSNNSLRLKEIFKSNASQLKNQLPALLLIDNSKYRFAEDPCLKTILLTNDHKQYTSLFPNYKLSENDSNIVDLPSLTNTIVLYQEYCFLGDNNVNDDRLFNPLNHIVYMKDVKSHLTKLILNSNGELKNSDYISKKVPYLKFEQFKEYLV